MPEPKDEKETQKTYAWSFDNGKMNCCESTSNTCNVAKLWEGAASAFHDAEIQQATKEINAILAELDRSNRDKARELRLVQIHDRHLLAWVHSDLVSSGTDQAIVAKALRLPKGPAKPTSPRQSKGVRT